jgi:hypothetical protein
MFQKELGAMVKQRHLRLSLNSALLLAACIGCDGSSKEQWISGTVCTKAGISGSYLTGDIELDAQYKPLSRASVRLCFDAEGKETVDDCVAVSDGQGKYKIRITAIPSPKNSLGRYYLMVQADGYDGIAEPITTGPLASYQRNTVVLKSQREK